MDDSRSKKKNWLFFDLGGGRKILEPEMEKDLSDWWIN